MDLGNYGGTDWRGGEGWGKKGKGEGLGEESHGGWREEAEREARRLVNVSDHHEGLYLTSELGLGPFLPEKVVDTVDDKAKAFMEHKIERRFIGESQLRKGHLCIARSDLARSRAAPTKFRRHNVSPMSTESLIDVCM